MRTSRNIPGILALAAMMAAMPHAALAAEKPGKPVLLVDYAVVAFIQSATQYPCPALREWAGLQLTQPWRDGRRKAGRSGN